MFEKPVVSRNDWILHCLCSLGYRYGRYDTSGSLEEGLFFRGSACDAEYEYLVESCRRLVLAEVPIEVVGSPCVDSTIQIHYSQLQPFAVVSGISLPLAVLDLAAHLGEPDERLWSEDSSVSMVFREASPLPPLSRRLFQNLDSKAMGNC
jgi:hypothetical protein